LGNPKKKPSKYKRIPKPSPNRRRAIKRKVKNGCSGKKRYTDLDKAKTGAYTLLERRPSKKHTTVYLCMVCGNFHVSSMKKSGWVVLFERTTDAETEIEPPVDSEGPRSRSESESREG